MRTVRRAGTHELTIQRSRFICSLAPAGTSEHASAFIETVRKQHWSASHNCTAYRIGTSGGQQRSNDDGEPAGTAGVPMLQVLLSREVTDSVVVVSRYFGGVKLGAGGLVRAYGRCVGEALDTVGTLDLVRHTTVTVTVDHGDAGRIEHDLRVGGLRIDAVDYAARVTFHLLAPTADVDGLRPWLARLTSGSAEIGTGATSLLALPDGG